MLGVEFRPIQRIILDLSFNKIHMKISLDLLHILDAIDRHGSFSAAAVVLHRVPSALSHAVAKLEDELDIQLFVREGRKATLNEAGRALLDDGRHLGVLPRVRAEAVHVARRLGRGEQVVELGEPCRELFEASAEGELHEGSDRFLLEWGLTPVRSLGVGPRSWTKGDSALDGAGTEQIARLHREFPTRGTQHQGQTPMIPGSDPCRGVSSR